jgi:hypothetical protein
MDDIFVVIGFRKVICPRSLSTSNLVAENKEMEYVDLNFLLTILFVVVFESSIFHLLDIYSMLLCRLQAFMSVFTN